MLRIPVYILAGGRSTRLGEDKARLDLAGVSMLEWAASQYLHLDPKPKVIADRIGKYDDLGYETLADLFPGRGPAGGLAAAFADHRRRTGQDGWLLITACDLLGVRKNWMAGLLAARRPGANWVAFRGKHWHPMPALVHTQQKLSDERALWRLIEAASPVALPPPVDWWQSADLNDARILGRLERHGGLDVDKAAILPLHHA